MKNLSYLRKWFRPKIKIKKFFESYLSLQMYTKFALALLASASLARNLDTSGTNEFQDFVGKFGRSYSTTVEMVNRMQVFLENRGKI